MTDWKGTAVRSGFVLLLAFLMLGAGAQSQDAKPAAIPWGAMYTPNEHLVDSGMTGAVKYYRGQRGADELIEDLRFARGCSVRLIATLGSVLPSDYLDDEDRIDMSAVHGELDRFFDLAEDVRSYIEDGTLWGIRFMDEPHDPKGYPRNVEVRPDELGEVLALIEAHFGEVRVGSTAPPGYMIDVPNADFACGQYNHANPPSGYEDAAAFHRDQSERAHEYGLDYVASINANTNPIGNAEFFQTYRNMCEIQTIDFATSWQWAQGQHEMPCFSARLGDLDPAVQQEIAGIPASCQR
jgi:hypothetical protein